MVTPTNAGSGKVVSMNNNQIVARDENIARMSITMASVQKFDGWLSHSESGGRSGPKDSIIEMSELDILTSECVDIQQLGG